MSGAVDILMFHSVSRGRGPLSIRADVFRRQMAVLERCGRRCISLGEYGAWRRGALDLASDFSVLTFDDGYEDFATVAFPEIRSRGWSCTVFLSTGLLREGDDGGVSADFEGRPLMSWRTIRELAANGVEFGAHGVSHTNLTELSAPDARRELTDSKSAIEAHTGRPVHVFAPPYGRSTAELRAQIGELFTCSVGTRMARATSSSPLTDLPRIEMWYFREVGHWRRYVERGTTLYFWLRKGLRHMRLSMAPSPRSQV